MDAQEHLQEAYMKVAENQQQLDEENRIVKFNEDLTSTTSSFHTFLMKDMQKILKVRKQLW